MAELVDAPDSKSGFRKKVQVRFLFRAHYNQLFTSRLLKPTFKFALKFLRAIFQKWKELLVVQN
jgi:hypothetical protein